MAWARRRSVWLHVDIDVVNPREFPAVAFAAIGGPSLSALGGLLRQLFSVADVKGFSLCGYDARADADRKLVAPLVEAFAGAVPEVPARA
ncbi:MAG: hypothetical protein E6J09_14370 [Chloroflexi bacterium]|nr:MAG: hypothetical protein E6J09_14370 [Chloroflexota bacterium]